MRFFLALARAKNLSAAGRALGVNHVTIARRVKSLEQHLQSRLFSHQQDGYHLTGSGEDLLRHALEAEQVMQAADFQVAGRDSQQQGKVVITAPGNLAQRIILPNLEAFSIDCPHIQISLLTTENLVNMAAREADIALRLTAKPPEYLIGRALLPLTHGLYASQRYLQQRGANAEILLYTSETTKPQWVKTNFPDARLALSVDDVSALHHAVRCNLGIARLPCFIADSDPELRRLDYSLPPSDFSIWLLNHVDLRDTRKIQTCRQFLTDVVLQAADLIQGKASNYSV